MFEYWIILVFCQLTLQLNIYFATFDINDLQLQMVADNLKVDECRKLSESIHENGFKPHHLIAGDSEPTGVSCLRLLRHWNTHEGKGQSFHLLELRLRQLGHNEVADRLAISIADEKVEEVRHTFLNDPFRSNILNNTSNPQHQSSGRIHSSTNAKWTGFELFQASIFLTVASIFLFFTCLFLVRLLLPDSFTRMRHSLYEIMLGRKPGDEQLFFVI
ncbi:hypothetical protein JTE90_018786 [Oedothorax gibbosus]|uniref:Death domain-containing protein n=1 Tax=Oedothorax gibbosus TaxID=931172 RepID=A0AAV6UA92_9ARAC|nr:hypothetical protein JTE90_018786 [Oedothorax gibbosus]